jgi:hypothetical protein
MATYSASFSIPIHCEALTIGGYQSRTTAGEGIEHRSARRRDEAHQVPHELGRLHGRVRVRAPRDMPGCRFPRVPVDRADIAPRRRLLTDRQPAEHGLAVGAVGLRDV